MENNKCIYTNNNINSYWNSAYKNLEIPNTPSSFAKFINTKLYAPVTIIDLGCGNGRDSIYFESFNHTVISVDSSDSINFLGNTENFHIIDICDIDIEADLYYARFFIHAIHESKFDILLKNLLSIMPSDAKFVFETRSTTCISDLQKQETNFKSSVGTEHFRMLYSTEYLKNKLSKDFNIEYLIETNNVAQYKSDNPYVIRGIVTKK